MTGQVRVRENWQEKKTQKNIHQMFLSNANKKQTEMNKPRPCVLSSSYKKIKRFLVMQRQTDNMTIKTCST